nr:hypothetical protein [Massilia sp. Se16.2.3]
MDGVQGARAVQFQHRRVVQRHQLVAVDDVDAIERVALLAAHHFHRTRHQEAGLGDALRHLRRLLHLGVEQLQEGDGVLQQLGRAALFVKQGRARFAGHARRCLVEADGQLATLGAAFGQHEGVTAGESGQVGAALPVAVGVDEQVFAVAHAHDGGHGVRLAFAADEDDRIVAGGIGDLAGGEQHRVGAGGVGEIGRRGVELEVAVRLAIEGDGAAIEHHRGQDHSL